jgi:hypothetical protein
VKLSTVPQKKKKKELHTMTKYDLSHVCKAVLVPEGLLICNTLHQVREEKLTQSDQQVKRYLAKCNTHS